MQIVLTRKRRRSDFRVISSAISNIKFGPAFLIASLVIFVSLITVITLLSSTKQVTKGYVLNSLDADHQSLVRVREVKDMQISQVRSLSAIQESSHVRSMVNADQIVYVYSDTVIASK